jgi:hypothetical protein
VDRAEPDYLAVNRGWTAEGVLTEAASETLRAAAARDMYTSQPVSAMVPRRGLMAIRRSTFTVRDFGEHLAGWATLAERSLGIPRVGTLIVSRSGRR